MSLSKEKQELLALLLAEEGVDLLEEQVIGPVADRTLLKPSFTQQRLWFMSQLVPDDPSYNISTNVLLKGELDVEVLTRGFNEIVRRHEALRTNFLKENGQPVLAVREHLALDVELIDLTHLVEPERSEEVTRLFRAEARKPFLLDTDPLIRTTLLKLAEDEHVLLLTIHHIVSDGWSMGVFLQELGVLYDAFRQGKPSPLPELSIQYADFAHWQMETLQGDVLEGHLSFWKDLLHGNLPVLQLPTDRPRPKIRSGKGRLQKFDIPSDLIDVLTEIGARGEATLYQVLLTAFNVMLYRYTGQEDVLVGAPIANRNRSEVEGLIGFLANTVVFRSDLSGEPTFRDLLTRVRNMARGVYANQDLPFVKLVEAVQPDRSMANTPLFQVFFVLQNAPMPAMELPGLKLSLMEMESATAKFDISLYIMEEGDGTIGMFEYSTDLFDPSSIDRMIEHFLNLLQSIVQNPDLAISELPMLSETEETRLLNEWSQGGTLAGTEGLPDVRIHELFEEQAARTPDRTALVFEGQSLTYGELNRRANALAHLLQQKGIGAESVVALCLDRSPEMVVALLGVLKSGGAYLPLDPKAPSERQRFVLEETESRVLLTQAHVLEELSSVAAGLEVIALDQADFSGISVENPVSNATADSLAYVIYTSGSTGKPKGVLVPHRGVSNRLLWGQEHLQLTEEDAVLQKTPYTFDVSVWEFLWPLMTGARLVLAKPEGHQDPSYLVDLIASEGITVAHFVPSMLALFLEEKELERVTSLRRVICSGEALSYELQERFFSRIGASLHNFYGPTETSIEVTYWDCQPESELRTVPIGYPVANVEAYVLDAHLRPVPTGVPGELYIGGVSVTRGYLKRPELTEEVFVAHPFRAGERLYKTGDLVRVLADGAIEYLGRLDHQVKIRGFRIELGEIEAALLADSSIREAVVLAREDVPGDKRLVAYLVSAGEEAPTVTELRSRLKETLPEYMVPSSYLFLDKMPLTSSGKADRKALPAPDALRPQLAAEYVEPRNELETTVVGMWKELLGVERVGVLDNFFDLGGHSLKATQLVAQVNDAFRVEVKLAKLFEEPTVAGLAQLIETAQNQVAAPESGPALVPLARQRTRRPTKG